MRKLRKVIILTVSSALLFVSGCNSFNRVSFEGPVILDSDLSQSQGDDIDVYGIRTASKPTPVAPAPVLPPKVITRERVVYVNRSDTTCPIFAMPILPETPANPLNDFKKLKQNELEKLDKIVFDYIDVLHKTLSDTRKIVGDAVNDYLAACKKTPAP